MHAQFQHSLALVFRKTSDFGRHVLVRTDAGCGNNRRGVRAQRPSATSTTRPWRPAASRWPALGNFDARSFFSEFLRLSRVSEIEFRRTLRLGFWRPNRKFTETLPGKVDTLPQAFVGKVRSENFGRGVPQ